MIPSDRERFAALIEVINNIFVLILEDNQTILTGDELFFGSPFGGRRLGRIIPPKTSQSDFSTGRSEIFSYHSVGKPNILQETCHILRAASSVTSFWFGVAILQSAK